MIFALFLAHFVKDNRIHWSAVLSGHHFGHYTVIDQGVARFQQNIVASVETGDLKVVSLHHSTANHNAVVEGDKTAVRIIAQRQKGIAPGQGICPVWLSDEATTGIASIEGIDAHPVSLKYF